MAIVLPQGVFNNSSDYYIRDFIAKQCRILAVVGLHPNTFKPHTGTKTSVLFVQKWNDDPKAGALCPYREDYPIFFATQQHKGKNNSGDKVFARDVKTGELLVDKHGHYLVEHDLFSTDLENGSKTADGIAEAFIEFASKEGLSFFLHSAFDEVKYRALLDGLEIFEIKLSEVLLEDKNFRIDSEFFKKAYILLNEKLSQHNFDYLDNLSLKITDGTHYTPEYCDTGIPFLSALNVHENILSVFDNYKFISEKAHRNLYKRCNPEKGDILLRKVGVGARLACVIPDGVPEFSLFVSVALIKCKNKVNQYFISTFINSFFGQLQLFRFNKGISQPDLHLEEIKKLKVPIFSFDFQIYIENLVKTANAKLEESKTLYTQASSLLLQELGLDNWQPPKEAVAIKNFSASFGATGRLDAEYYQPKYDDVVAEIKTSSNGYGKVKEICKLHDKNYRPQSNKIFKYIELGNIGSNG